LASHVVFRVRRLDLAKDFTFAAKQDDAPGTFHLLEPRDGIMKSLLDRHAANLGGPAEESSLGKVSPLRVIGHTAIRRSRHRQYGSAVVSNRRYLYLQEPIEIRPQGGKIATIANSGSRIPNADSPFIFLPGSHYLIDDCGCSRQHHAKFRT
jgi:hypothetical protein